MTFFEIAANYADEVDAGDIPACEIVTQACQRFIRDIDRIENDPDFPFDLDPDIIDRWCRFLQTLPHVKGKWAAKREAFILSPWQVFVTLAIFGFGEYQDGRFVRRIREAYISVPRKNGKSFWAAIR